MRKTLSTFPPSVTVDLNLLPSYTRPLSRSCFHQFEVSMALQNLVNRRHGIDGRTERQTDGQSARFDTSPWWTLLCIVLQESLGVNLGSSFEPAEDFPVVYNSTYQTTQKDLVYINLGKLTNTGNTLILPCRI